jgi:hypothetical protein
LPQSGRDVVPLRQRVQAGGDVRVERHLQERVVGFSEGVQIQGQGKKYDDEYWVKLAKAHKQ